ncbi:hypothetical protein [Oricola thermophila]|uniref:LapA family protein n=1 Tax=Oricola thermophila TaxID=2742145 RepID=A0A6N1VHC4_9HYPH|nr:hypothetical protein [Oricola thermophila]QKV18702.1 hypothetical protein HTY61_09700 [Oricola thermophila]
MRIVRLFLTLAAAAVFLHAPLAIAADAPSGGVRFDLTVNLTAIITIAVMAAGGIAAWVTVRNRVRTHSETLAVHAEKVEALGKRIEQVRAKSAHELSEFKLEVARNYATVQSVANVEERIAAALEKLDDRLEKLDSYLRDLAAAPSRRARRDNKPE